MRMSKRLSPGAAAATELRRSWHRLLWNMGLESLKGQVGYRAPAPCSGFWVFARGLPQGSFGRGRSRWGLHADDVRIMQKL